MPPRYPRSSTTHSSSKPSSSARLANGITSRTGRSRGSITPTAVSGRVVIDRSPWGSSGRASTAADAEPASHRPSCSRCASGRLEAGELRRAVSDRPRLQERAPCLDPALPWSFTAVPDDRDREDRAFARDTRQAWARGEIDPRPPLRGGSMTSSPVPVRRLGTAASVALYVTAVVGPGILTLPAAAAQEA